MEFQGVDFPRAFPKSEPIEREIYVLPPLFEVKVPSGSWGLSQPLYGLATARKERCATLKFFLTENWGGGAPAMKAKSVFFWWKGMP